MQTENKIDTAALPVTDGPEPALTTERDWSELKRLFEEASEEVRKAIEKMAEVTVNGNSDFYFSVANYLKGPTFFASHYSSALDVSGSSLPELLAKIAVHKPADAKARKIAELERQLAELKGQ